MDLSPYLILIVANPLVRWVFGLLVVNVIAGVAAAAYTGTFRLAALGDWLYQRALPYVLVAAGLQLLVALALPEQQVALQVISTGVWAFVTLALLGHILDTARDLGLPIPAVLTDRETPAVNVVPTPAGPVAAIASEPVVPLPPVVEPVAPPPPAPSVVASPAPPATTTGGQVVSIDYERLAAVLAGMLAAARERPAPPAPAEPVASAPVPVGPSVP